MAASEQSNGVDYEIDISDIVKIAVTGKYEPLNDISWHQAND
jgi:hypothetical protein